MYHGDVILTLSLTSFAASIFLSLSLLFYFFKTTLSTMMMLADFINSDALVKDLSAVAEDPVPLVDSGAAKRSLPLDVDSPSEPPSKKMRGSSSRRIKCKARGLSNNHNSDNAYFEIPADPPHGLLVSCSHPECVGSGRRGFRYCQGKKLVNVLLFCRVDNKVSHRSFFFTEQFVTYQSRRETSSSDMGTALSNLLSSCKRKSMAFVALPSTLLNSS